MPRLVYTYNACIETRRDEVYEFKPVAFAWLVRLHIDAMAASSQQDLDDSELFAELDAYPWDNDTEFQVGFHAGNMSC